MSFSLASAIYKLLVKGRCCESNTFSIAVADPLSNMTQSPVPNWHDEATHPLNADTTTGWAGVPLSQTLGYYGHIKRAVLPTNSQLGFAPNCQSVGVDKIAEAFVTRFAKAIQAQDVDAVVECIYKEATGRISNCLHGASGHFTGPRFNLC